jgi:hypothetical protein
VLSKGLDEQASGRGRGPLRELDFDPRVAKDPGPAPGGLFGGVVAEIDDASDAGLDKRVRARRLATLVGARLERHVRGRAGGIVSASSAVPERGALCMEAAQLNVPALAERLAAARDDTSDHGVGRDQSAPAFGNLECPGEVRAVVLGHRRCHQRVLRQMLLWHLKVLISTDGTGTLTDQSIRKV